MDIIIMLQITVLTLKLYFISADEDFELNFRTDLDILENTGSQICVNVTIIDDELVEGVEVFGLTLDSRDQAVTFTIQSGAFVEIQDNDCEYIK